MDQYCLSVTTTREAASSLADSLEVTLEDDGLPVSLFEVDEDSAIWRVSLYVQEEQLHGAETKFQQLVNEISPEIVIDSELLPQTNWVAHTLSELHSVRAGRFLVHGSHDIESAKPNDFTINIDAGLAFGTGHHGTTAGCLDMLEEAMKKRAFSNALDLGTGSGVLAIAYAIATKKPILATDIDPIAVEVTSDNTRKNNVEFLVDSITANGFGNRKIASSKPYDLVIANILAGPLQKMARDFARHCNHGATIILSGLLPHQRKRILATFRIQGFYFHQAHIRDNWLTLLLRYKVSK